MSIDLAAIKARAEVATPAPWRNRGIGHVYGPDVIVAVCGVSQDEELRPFSAERWNADAAFIAAARQDVPALVERAEQQAKEIERLREALERCAARYSLGEFRLDKPSPFTWAEHGEPLAVEFNLRQQVARAALEAK